MASVEGVDAELCLGCWVRCLAYVADHGASGGEVWNVQWSFGLVMGVS